jgi:hypothetical protein
MYPQELIRTFNIKANETLNETFKVLLEWDLLLNEHRAAMGLAALHRISILADDLSDIKNVFENAFPTVSMEVIQKWKSKLWEIIYQDSTITSPEYEEIDTLDSFIDGLELDDETKQTVKESSSQLSKKENEIKRALSSAISRLMDIVLELEAATHEDRTKHNALLYANAKGRYFEDHWKAKGPKELERKIHNHCPWGYPASENDLKSLYQQIHDDFRQTKLGAIYEDCYDDELVLANSIAQSGCSQLDLQDFFHGVFLLQDLGRLIRVTHEQNPSADHLHVVNIEKFYTDKVVNTGTLINKPGASISLYDMSGNDPSKQIEE